MFPTTDPYTSTPLRTANFFTQEDIGGARTESINDAELRNAPDTTLANRGAGVPLLITIGLVFRNVDQQPSIRQLYPIAELGKPEGTPTRAPQFMRLLVAPEQPRIPGTDLDFRDEIMAQIFDKGDPFPKRTLTYTIELTDEGETTGPASRERRTFKTGARWGRWSSTTPSSRTTATGDPFQPPDVAQRPQRSGHGHPRQRPQGEIGTGRLKAAPTSARAAAGQSRWRAASSRCTAARSAPPAWAPDRTSRCRSS